LWDVDLVVKMVDKWAFWWVGHWAVWMAGMRAE
jgi:hypothetical protein